MSCFTGTAHRRRRERQSLKPYELPADVRDVELILALMVALAVVATAARALRVPYPILLVLGGLLLALTPGMPHVALAPELIFLLFLPPLVYIAGYEISPRDIGTQLRPILSLAVGLVLVSTLLVGAIAYALLPEIGWPVAFALEGRCFQPPTRSRQPHCCATSAPRGAW